MANKNEPELEISLVRDDLIFLAQRRIGLIPERGLGILRRALFFALLTWLPLVIWSFLKGTALHGQINKPLLNHFGIHARFLVAIPLMILGEGMMHNVLTKLIPYFYTSGLVRDEHKNAFTLVIQKAISLRNSKLPWVVIATIVCLSVIFQPAYQDMHELDWANVGTTGQFNLGFGGWWMIFVSRPISTALVWISLWRLILVFLIFKWIAALDLELVPTHPDRAGGLGFLEKIPTAFSLFVFAISLVLASRLAHDVIYHGMQLQSLKSLLVVYLIVIAVLFLSPLMTFIPKLSAAKRRARLEYGALVGNHGRLVYRRWIRHEPIADDALLQAPELGPVADTLSLYEAAIKMRSVPIGKTAVLGVVLPAAIPLLALFALQVPIKDIIMKLFSIIF
ncbi:MAG: hypothetical protein ACXW1Z_23995 [Methylobacter sp.]